ncbi:MAG: S-layer homology domain-containing protein, partial [Clostridia bacterium]|nr:S-layer homology domain-containing protein [Clostridia bacterium]
MKKTIKMAMAFILAFTLVLPIIAAPIVSPALNVIAKNNRMIKSALISSDVYFSENDFMKCLGTASIDSVKLTELPPSAEGILKLGTLVVTEGQSIKREYLSLLRFVPADERVLSSSFEFSCGDTIMPCTVKFLEEVNFAPVFAKEENEVSTYRDVSYYGNVTMSDPEGDNLDLQIVSYPSHGVLTVTDSLRGSYVYTPTAGFVGDDEFTVVARDNFGNYSLANKVEVRVEKNEVIFTDTNGHWCENAAICLYKKGIADVAVVNEELVFSPEDKVTREEFVVMAMKALKVETLTDSNTSFADNSAISVGSRPYVATAERLGYVKGKEKDGLMYFDPAGAISKSEA